MSIKPIDLQNLFVRLNEISRDQAARQEAPLHAQQVTAQEIEQETRQADERVQQTADTGDGPTKLHDDQKRGGNRHTEHKAKEGSGDAEEKKPKEDPFRDPDLGNRIDIST